MPNFDETELARSVGKAIAQYRQAAQLTQDEVAERLGIGNEAVSRMERGIVVPTIVRLVELAEIFQCAASDFLAKTSTLATDQTYEIQRLLAPLDPHDRTMLIEILERLVQRLHKK